MKYNLTNKINVRKAKERLEYLIKKGSNIELKEIKKIGTLKQMKYAHLLFSAFGLHFGYSLEEVKQDVFKRYVNKSTFISVKENIEVCRSITDLDTKELSICIERFRNYSSQNGLYLPEPNEKEILQSIQNQMYKYENQIFL